MATLDDKLLGEKLHYYCSSSEDEGEDNESTARESVPPVTSDGGASINTGPKGVIKDWQRYKQLEREERADQEAEKLALAKRLALTCRTDKEDQEAKEREENVDAEFEVSLLSFYSTCILTYLKLVLHCSSIILMLINYFFSI